MIYETNTLQAFVWTHNWATSKNYMDGFHEGCGWGLILFCPKFAPTLVRATGYGVQLRDIRTYIEKELNNYAIPTAEIEISEYPTT